MFVVPAALAVVYVVWGSTYLAIRVMVETMPPLLSAGVRFARGRRRLPGCSCACAGGAEQVRVTRRQVAGAALIGTLLCFGGNGLVTVAEQEVPSGLAALIIGAVPLWVVVMRSPTATGVPRGHARRRAVGFVGLAVLRASRRPPGRRAALGRARCRGGVDLVGRRLVLLQAHAAPRGRARLDRAGR